MPTHTLFMHETIATKQIHSTFHQLSPLVIITLSIYIWSTNSIQIQVAHLVVAVPCSIQGINCLK